MNEYVIGGPGGLVGFLGEMGLDGDWNEDTHSLIKNSHADGPELRVAQTKRPLRP